VNYSWRTSHYNKILLLDLRQRGRKGAQRDKGEATTKQFKEETARGWVRKTQDDFRTAAKYYYRQTKTRYEVSTGIRGEPRKSEKRVEKITYLKERKLLIPA